MTWEYSISDNGENMDVYDHTGTLIQTLQNDGGGFRLPEDVYEVMINEVISRGLNDTSEWQTQSIIAVAADDIQEKRPNRSNSL